MAVLPAPEKFETLTTPTAAGTAATPRLPGGLHHRLSTKTGNVLNWLIVAACVYVLITAVNVIGSGFSLAAGDQASSLFEFAANPIVGLMIGIAATALSQSSSTTTSVTVGLVAGGLPLSIAVPIILGANIGTTLTNTLVSLGMVRDKAQFRRGFAAATVHDFFNLLAVAIFLPLEIAFGLLERIASASASALSGTDGGIIAMIFGGLGTVVKGATTPLAQLITWSLSWLPGIWAGVAMIVVAIALILAVINLIGRKLRALLVGRAQRVLNSAIGRGPITSIGSGAVVTVMVQSSSTTTALMVPLAGSGALSLRQLYPFALGANIGTTITALVAAFAFDGEMGTIALTAALVHLFFNVLGTAVIYGIPVMRDIPLKGAEWLSGLAAERTPVALAWVLGVFVALPLALIFLL
ncbi:Na/Pi symporter [Nesterenkonia sphaerica]|uniref:Na/Pi cotransporter family protein n=1 Tax=Nesterenkonia sphaerica TaxID=1804988 RepID=A0A5R9ANN9_9MICC|nr:Na/Pi symporter [Nesterenkonia sphaerica]TLP80059.1 Na/Pi cotransporter family protein [Nesterenkonia sphaerica]